MGLDLQFYKIDSSGNRTNLEYFGITFLRDNLHLFVDLLIEYAYNYKTNKLNNKNIDVYDTYCHNSIFNTIIFDVEYQVINELKEDFKYELNDDKIEKIKELVKDNKLSELRKFYQKEIEKLDKIINDNTTKYMIDRVNMILDIMKKYKDSDEDIYYELF
jgi:hypothetical protein